MNDDGWTPKPQIHDRFGRWPANVALDEEAAALLGEPSRFFYCAKASKRDRTMDGQVENRHPTVKPTDLMRWLVRMVRMPERNLILDPFAGSGSTGVACALERVPFVGCELSEEYVEIARSRIRAAAAEREPATLFEGVSP